MVKKIIGPGSARTGIKSAISGVAKPRVITPSRTSMPGPNGVAKRPATELPTRPHRTLPAVNKPARTLPTVVKKTKFKK